MSQYKIVKIDHLSGSECSIYTIIDSDDETKTFIDKFIDENYFLRKLSVLITKRIIEREIVYINDDLDFDGNLVFSKEEF